MEKIRATANIREILLRTIINQWIEEESKKVNETSNIRHEYGMEPNGCEGDLQRQREDI